MNSVLNFYVNKYNYANKIIRQYFKMSSKKYEEAVNCINSLQSNVAYLDKAVSNSHQPTTYETTVSQIRKYLERVGISQDILDKLSVIHISGTKGKGSTCAYCESILRNYGYKTGLYTSPHLISMTERIRIDGRPIDKDLFADEVSRIYHELMSQREYSDDMPLYFRFLTIVAFSLFIKEGVDVALVEVGIGGEYDCTNVLRKKRVVGITSLGMDHVKLLGGSIESIAWQKAGIMRKDTPAFTVPDQPPTAAEVLNQRAKEIQCRLQVVPSWNEYIWEGGQAPSSFANNVQKLNASLAIQLSHTWMKGENQNVPNNESQFIYKIPKKTCDAINSCRWPGRFQILKKDNITVYLDGAHTEESIKECAEWFAFNSHSKTKVLIFNMTGKRDVSVHLSIINNTTVFNHAIFVPNIAHNDTVIKDQQYMASDKSLIENCTDIQNVWKKINSYSNSETLTCLADAIKSCQNMEECDVLITGSLHLVGAALAVLDPDKKCF